MVFYIILLYICVYRKIRTILSHVQKRGFLLIFVQAHLSFGRSCGMYSKKGRVIIDMGYYGFLVFSIIIIASLRYYWLKDIKKAQLFFGAPFFPREEGRGVNGDLAVRVQKEH